MSRRASLGFSLLLALAALLIAWQPDHKHEPTPAPAAPEMLRRDLILRDGRLYRHGQSVSFAGFMIERYESGALKSRSAISQGLLHGVSEGWHINGLIEVREHFVHGISHGRRQKWHANGQQMSEAGIVQGKLEGLYRRWHDNGRLAEEMTMQQDAPEGMALAYYPSGFLKTEARLHRGKLVAQQFWPDGELSSRLTAQTTPVR